MRFVRAARFRLRALLDRSALDHELELELRDHIERETRANVARGMKETDARRLAVATFGGVQRYKEEARDARGMHWLDEIAQDARYALRSLRRTPAFTAVAVITLALGVGANTAVFTVVDRVLLRPLPFRDPGALYLVSQLPKVFPFELPPGLADRLYLAYRDRARAFESLAAFQRAELTLSGSGDATRLAGARIGARLFATLGVQVARGRSFTTDEEIDGRDRVAILSDRIWHERFGGDPTVIGRTITLDRIPRTVVGIAPPEFSFPASSDVWIPLAIRLDRGNSFILSVLGRLKPGVTTAQATSELEAISRAMPRDPRDGDAAVVSRVIPLKDALTGNVQTSLIVFAGAVAFVLLIAGANVANLLLIRASTRRQELAIRGALGANRGRIVKQLLTESTLLAVIGGALGVLVAFVGVRALVAMAPAGRIPRLAEVRVDGWVLAFSLAVSLATGVLFGFVPALHGSRRQPQDELARASSRTVAGAQSGARAAFAIAQIALALVLLTGAALMVKSFARMRRVDTGYRADHVVTMTVNLSSVAYPDAPRIRLFHSRVLDRLRQIPGVAAAASVSFRPMQGVGVMGDFVVDGATPFPHGFTVDKPTVSAGYFGAMGIRVLRGREFSPRDDDTARGVVVVSESVARKLWPGSDAIGKRISMSDTPGPNDWLTVVGVVSDVVQDRDMRRHSTIYLPYLQTASPFFINQMTYVVRTSGEPAAVGPDMRAALRDVDPAVPAQALQTMEQSMLLAIAEPLFQTRLLVAFSALALALAAIGTYGVLSYQVAERSREIAIRVALGAEASRVVGMIVRHTLAFALAGVVVGSAGALLATRVLSRFLYDVSATDPAIFGLAALLLASVALAAGLLPARRAARVDPLIVLRNE
jgi:putative ABC transport system permease protein